MLYSISLLVTDLFIYVFKTPPNLTSSLVPKCISSLTIKTSLFIISCKHHNNTASKVLFAVLCLVIWSCPTLCNPMDCSPPGSSFHGILQARILEWIAMPSSRRHSQPRNIKLMPPTLQEDSLPSEPAVIIPFFPR